MRHSVDIQDLDALESIMAVDDQQDLDILLDSLVGKRVNWHGQVGVIARIGPRDPETKQRKCWGIRVTLRCSGGGWNEPRCKKRTVVYAISGCHHGAFCYVANIEGKYLADLRNSEFICTECQNRRHEKLPWMVFRDDITMYGSDRMVPFGRYATVGAAKAQVQMLIGKQYVAPVEGSEAKGFFRYVFKGSLLIGTTARMFVVCTREGAEGHDGIPVDF